MNFLIKIFYQPFLNLLVTLYYLMDWASGGRADMGIVVIIFTVIIRILLLPLTISGTRTEKEKHEIAEKAKQLRRQFSADPVAREAQIKKLLKLNKRVVFSSSTALAVQIILALILWRIFAVGLLGRDLHFLYDFIHQPEKPFNLAFLGKYDLTHPNLTLNLLQSFLIIVLELEISLFSMLPITRRDIIATQLILPAGSYLIFSQMPAGKKLFIITTLLFSILYTTFRQIRYWWHRWDTKAAAAKPPSEP